MKRAKKIFLLLFVLALSLSSLLFGCSNKETAGEEGKRKDGRVVVDFWTFWGSEIRRPIIEKIIDDFNKSQNKIYVKHTYLPWGDIWTKELAAVAAGNPPDLIVQDINTVAQRAQKNQNTNLAKYIKKDPEIKKRFFPKLYNATLYKGDPYALPFNTDTRILFYNKDAFKEAGLDPEKPPQTWEELENYGKKLDIKKGGHYERIGYVPGHGIGPDIWMINANGKGFWDYEKNKPIINSDTNVVTLEWFKKYQDYYGQKELATFKAEFGDQSSDPFISGKVAMITEAATFYTKIRDYGNGMNFGVAPLPEREPGSGHTSWGGGFVLEIPRGAKHADAAWEFMKYLTDVKAQEYWAVKNFDNVANIEAAKKAAKSPELTVEAKKVYDLATKNMENTILTPVPLATPDYLNLVKPEIDAALLGKKTPKEALDDAQKAVEKLVKSNK
ncbi:ABC transporter substrate-binding protein [Parageobacillus sp. VR-IP]|uniref:ABC transporter substrate-binding protein n=1 Tax=Parageobacillus sp. VR-IP TaxID=2742205 RepID=UPI001581A28E|nr:ABC transporter substrate-binding protein [Parageobacillus sp. VR-IP]NUK30254.1 ABC transporter substrate-binding protein [Parageobacillus sp. VR-IP]